MFYEGMKVKIVKNTIYHNYPIGEIGVIIYVTEEKEKEHWVNGKHFCKVKLDKLPHHNGNFLSEKDVIILSPVDISLEELL